MNSFAFAGSATDGGFATTGLRARAPRLKSTAPRGRRCDTLRAFSALRSRKPARRSGPWKSTWTARRSRRWPWARRRAPLRISSTRSSKDRPAPWAILGSRLVGVMPGQRVDLEDDLVAPLADDEIDARRALAARAPRAPASPGAAPSGSARATGAPGSGSRSGRPCTCSGSRRSRAAGAISTAPSGLPSSTPTEISLPSMKRSTITSSSKRSASSTAASELELVARDPDAQRRAFARRLDHHGEAERAVVLDDVLARVGLR